jgi:hypothetical protein
MVMRIIGDDDHVRQAEELNEHLRFRVKHQHQRSLTYRHLDDQGREHLCDHLHEHRVTYKREYLEARAQGFTENLE